MILPVPVVHAQQTELGRARALNKDVNRLYRQGRYSEAIPKARAVLSIFEKILGPHHPNLAVSLNNLALLYKSSGDYSRAKPLYEKALRIKENALGSAHPDLANNLINLALLYKSTGDFHQAEQLLNRALIIQETAFGADHLKVASSLSALALLYQTLGDYEKAEPLYKRALSIREKSLGRRHPDVAQSMNNLAGMYYSKGDFQRAESLYLKGLTFREQALGKNHPSVATGLNNLAMLYKTTGDYSRAEPLYRRALAITEKALGENHPDVAVCLNNLAGLYYSSGNYQRAENLYRRALAIRERVLYPGHPDVAQSLHNLGVLYIALGDYARARPLYERGLAAVENAFGVDHPSVAAALSNLAELYRTIGDYHRAEPLYIRALRIKEKTLGPNHPDVAKSLNNLALLYDTMGNSQKTEALYLRSLSINEQHLGHDHPDVATGLINLADLYQSRGWYRRAEQLYRRAIGILEHALGKNHPYLAHSLNNLGRLYYHQRNYAGAEQLLERALEIQKNSLGSKHPGVASTLNDLAFLNAAIGRYEKANDLKQEANRIDQDLIEQVMSFTSEDQKFRFLATRRSDLHASLSLINQYLRGRNSARKQALDLWLKRKGIILEAQKRFQEALVCSDAPEVQETFKKLSRIRSQISLLALSSPQKEGLTTYKANLTNLEATENRLEARLGELSRIYELNRRMARADSNRVAAALPDQSALLEFARIEPYNFEPGNSQDLPQSHKYLAFVLHAGKSDHVDMIDLGNAERIERAILRYKKIIVDRMDLKGIRADKFARQIYDLVFAPVKYALGDTREIFISPDGNLNLIPFEVFQAPDGRFLIEDYTFNYIASGRDILGFGKEDTRGSKSLLIGDPDFNADFKDKHRPPSSSLYGNSGFPLSVEFKNLRFRRLPLSREEVETIYSLTGHEKSELYTGKSASEKVLARINSPRILHLATHGFFMSDIELTGIGDDMIGMKRKNRSRMEYSSMGPTERNPLLRSGIALAGANHALQYGIMETNDGIVTADQILGLQLRGTDMVVLSACETGLGEVQAGEGVYGLRRAFSQAGAKSLIMSMWAVPDIESKELMIEFYRQVLSGMNRCQALRQAALKEMDTVSQRYGGKNPLFWGAFVFMGDPYPNGGGIRRLDDTSSKGASATCFVSTVIDE